MKKTSKVLALLLALLMLCSVFALAGCNKGEGKAESSETVSEEVKPSKLELLTDAVSLYKNYLTNAMDTSGIKVIEAPSAYKSDLSLLIDKLTLMGTALFGDDPIGATGSAVSDGKTYKMDADLLCAGESIPFVGYLSDGKLAMEYPTLTDKVIGMGAEVAEAEGTAQYLSMLNSLPDIITCLKEALEESLDPEKAIVITEENGSTTYSLNISDEQFKVINDKFNEKLKEKDLEDLFSEADTEPDDTSSEEKDSLEFSLTVKDDLPVSMKLTCKTGDEIVLGLDVLTSSTNQISTVDVKLVAGETVVDLSGKLVAAKDALKLEASVSVSSIALSLKADVTKKDDKTELAGSLEVTVDQGGMKITIPLNVSGSQSGDEKEMTNKLTLSASIASMIDLSISFDQTVKAEAVTVPEAPKDTVSIDTVSEEMGEKLLSEYPKTVQVIQTLASLFGGGSGEPDVPTDSYAFMAADETLFLSVEDGMLYLSATCLTKDDGKNLEIYYLANKPGVSIPYSVDSDGNFTMLGATFENVEEGVLMAETEIGDLTLFIYEGGVVDVMIYLPYTVNTDGSLQVSFPDGTAFPYTIFVSEEAAQIGELTVPAYIYEE